MFLKFKPTWMLEAIYQLTPEQLEKHQIKAILTDLDNTLIAWNNPDGTTELKEWLEAMATAGIPVIVVSNNKAERVERAVAHLGLDYVARALKPLAKGMNEGAEKLQLPKENIVMVGDQIMTDIRASNGAGIRSILVQPIVASDAWNTKPNRAMEKIIVTHLKKQDANMKWRSELL